MSLDKSEVMGEFLKIAEEQDLLGDKTAGAEPNPHQEDKKTIEEKRLKPEEKHIVEQAHPEPVYIAEALGDGALVENQLEQQQKLVEMVNKAPNGALLGQYASVVEDLVKMANTCDDMGMDKAADLLTEAAQSVVAWMPMGPESPQCPYCGDWGCQCEEYEDEDDYRDDEDDEEYRKDDEECACIHNDRRTGLVHEEEEWGSALKKCENPDCPYGRGELKHDEDEPQYVGKGRW